MKFISNEKYFFFPDVNGNLELPESERLSVEIIRPTAEDRGTVSWAEGAAQKAGHTYRMKFNTSHILQNNVGVIKNMTVGNKAITCGKELASVSFAGMNALVDIICAEVCSDELSDAQKKISESEST